MVDSLLETVAVVQQDTCVFKVLAGKVSQDQIAFQIKLGFFGVGDGFVGYQPVDVRKQIADAYCFSVVTL